MQLRLDRPEVEMLARKPAWERAVVYDAVNLSLPEREQVEVAVRARIAAEVGPR